MSEKNPGTDRHRVQLDFSEDGMTRLAQLRKDTDARTNAEVVRNALRLYEWFVAQKKEQSKIHVVNGASVKEVEFAF